MAPSGTVSNMTLLLIWDTIYCKNRNPIMNARRSSASILNNHAADIAVYKYKTATILHRFTVTYCVVLPFISLCNEYGRKVCDIFWVLQLYTANWGHTDCVCHMYLHDMGVSTLTCGVDGPASVTAGSEEITLSLLMEVLNCRQSSFLGRKVQWSRPCRDII